MGKTVISFYPDANSADAVMHKLLESGHSRADLKVFSDTAAGEGPAGSPAEAAGTGIADGHSQSELGHNFYSLRNASIMLSVAVSDDRAEAVARFLREHGARDVQVREGNWNQMAAGTKGRGAGGPVLGAEPPKRG